MFYSIKVSRLLVDFMFGAINVNRTKIFTQVNLLIGKSQTSACVFRIASANDNFIGDLYS